MAVSSSRTSTSCQQPLCADAAGAVLFPPLCVYYHRTLYSPPFSFSSLFDFAALRRRLSRLSRSARVSPSRPSCDSSKSSTSTSCCNTSSFSSGEARSNESSNWSDDNSRSNNLSDDNGVREVFLDASSIVLRVYCILANLRVQFVPLRYPSAHAAATLPAALYDSRVLQARQILLLLQRTRDLDALAAASAARIRKGTTAFLEENVIEPAPTSPAAAAAFPLSPLSTGNATTVATTPADAAAAAGGTRTEKACGHCGEPNAAAAVVGGTGPAEPAAGREVRSEGELQERGHSNEGTAAGEKNDEQRKPECLETTGASAAAADTQLLQRWVQLQSAAVAAFVEQRLGAALQYILWVYEPCRKHFTSRVFRQNLPLFYAAPLLLWARRTSLQQQQAVPLKEVLLDVVAVLELLELQRMQQQRLGPTKQHWSQELQQPPSAETSSTGVALGDACSAASWSAGEAKLQLTEEEATAAETAPGTEAAAADEEEEEATLPSPPRPEGLAAAAAAEKGGAVVEGQKVRLQPDFLLLPGHPTLADVYLYAYLFVLLQLPAHLLPWHEEETAAAGAAAATTTSPATVVASGVSAFPAASSSSGGLFASSLSAGRRAPAAEGGGGAWLSSDATLLNFCDGACSSSSKSSEAGGWWLWYQQQEEDEERKCKKRIVQLLPLARQYVRRFEGMLLIQAACASSGEAAAAATAARARCLSEGVADSLSAEAAAAAAGADCLKQEGTTEAYRRAGPEGDGTGDFVFLTPKYVPACSAGSGALCGVTLPQQQQIDRGRRNRGSDDTSSGGCSSSKGLEKPAQEGGLPCMAEQRSNSRDKGRRCKVAGTAGESACAGAVASNARMSSRSQLTRETCCNSRGLLAVGAAAAAGALVLYVGAAARTGCKRFPFYA